MWFSRGAGGLVEGARTNGPQAATPSVEFIESLKENQDQQRLALIQTRLERFSRQGEQSLGRNVRELRDGLWEIKAGDVRLPFFHIDETMESRCDRGTVIRLTHGFIKRGMRAPEAEINRARWIWGEDRQSDHVT